MNNPAQPGTDKPADLMAHEVDTEQEAQALRPEPPGHDLRGGRHGGIAGQAQYDDEQEHRKHRLGQQEHEHGDNHSADAIERPEHILERQTLAKEAAQHRSWPTATAKLTSA